jgi:hypothetical protein
LNEIKIANILFLKDSKMQKSIIETKDISLSLPAQQNEDTFIEKKKKSNRKTISTPDELIKCDKDVKINLFLFYYRLQLYLISSSLFLFLLIKSIETVI